MCWTFFITLLPYKIAVYICMQSRFVFESETKPAGYVQTEVVQLQRLLPNECETFYTGDCKSYLHNSYLKNFYEIFSGYVL